MPVKLIAGRVHMEEYLRGWRDEEDVILPPLEKRGFLDNVIIREPVEPINKELSEKGITFIVDSTQELLMNVLKYNPFLIKPNKEELEETLNCKISTKEDIVNAAKELKKMGAQNVLVSLGNDGALLLTKEDETYYSKAPKGQVVNTVGSGDSMVAGFLAGYYQTQDYEYALKVGVAAGSASAFSIRLATKEDVDLLLKQL